MRFNLGLLGFVCGRYGQGPAACCEPSGDAGDVVVVGWLQDGFVDHVGDVVAGDRVGGEGLCGEVLGDLVNFLVRQGAAERSRPRSTT